MIASPRIAWLATLVGLLLLSGPLTAGAQPARQIARIGYLGATSPSEFPGRLEAFRQDLRDQGYVDGQNTVIEFRWADGRSERLAELASDLVQVLLRADQVIELALTGSLPARGRGPAAPARR